MIVTARQCHPSHPQVYLHVLRFACPDARVREKLTPTILHRLLDRYREGMKHAMFLVDVEWEKLPYTWNEIFNSNLQTSRGRRIAAALAPKARRETSKNFGTSKLANDSSTISGIKRSTMFFSPGLRVPLDYFRSNGSSA